MVAVVSNKQRRELMQVTQELMPEAEVLIMVVRF